MVEKYNGRNLCLYISYIDFLKSNIFNKIVVKIVNYLKVALVQKLNKSYELISVCLKCTITTNDQECVSRRR